MGRKNKAFEPKGQKETKDLFRELFDKHLPPKNQETTGKLELGGHRGFADPWKGFNDPLTQMLNDFGIPLIRIVQEFLLHNCRTLLLSSH